MSFGGSFGTVFDYRKLATSLLYNNQWHTPPSDTIRMGIVVGYDPNWQSDTETYSHPFLSIQMEGDSGPMHGFRFLESYIPKIGDTVWVVWSGEDAWVLGALAGSNIYDQGSTLNGKNGTIQRKRSPMTLIGHQAFLEITAVAGTGATGVTTVVPPGMTGTYPGATCYRLDATGLETDFLPNRIYRAEATLRFKINGAAPYYQGSTAAVPAGNVANAGTISANSVSITSTASTGTNPFGGIMMWGRIRNGTGSTYSLTYGGQTYYANQVIQNLTGHGSGLTNLLSEPGTTTVMGYGIPFNTQLAVQQVFTDASQVGGLWNPQPPFVIMNNAFSINDATNSSTIAAIGNEYPVGDNNGSPGATATVFSASDGDSSVMHNQPYIFQNVGSITSTGAVGITYPNPLVTVGGSTATIPTSSKKSLVSIGVLTPTNTYQPQAHYEEMQLLDVTGTPDGTYFTIHCSTTFWVTPTNQIVGGSWVGLNTTGPTNEWYLAVIPNGTSGSVPTVTFTAASNPNNDPSLQLDDTQRFVIYDCGVAQ